MRKESVMNNIKKSAKKLRKALNNKVTPESVIGYLQNLGYTIIFFSDDSEVLKKENLVEYSQGKNAFTCLSDELNAVYVRNGLSEEEMLCSLLHETAHIIFKHLEKRDGLRNKRREEMTAEVFAYTVLNPPKYNKLIIMFIMSFILGNSTNLLFKVDSVPVSTLNHTEYVCITSTGTKYHRESCGHIHSDTAYIERSEADKLFEPCKGCNP